MKPVFLLAILALSGSAAERPEREALMDEIESKVRLPAAAHRLDEYGRYYAFEGKRRVAAVYLLPPEPLTPDPRPADWGCEEVVSVEGGITTREIPCPPDPDISHYLRAGQRRWVANRKALPFVADGGCMIVHLSFNLDTREVEDAFCNGSA